VSRWYLATRPYRCGYDLGHELEDGALIWRMGNVIRCKAHAPAHASISPAELDALRHAQEAIRAEQQARSNAIGNLRRSEAQDGFTSLHSGTGPLNALLKRQGIKGYRRSSPKPYDPSMGSREDA